MLVYLLFVICVKMGDIWFIEERDEEMSVFMMIFKMCVNLWFVLIYMICVSLSIDMIIVLS